MKIKLPPPLKTLKEETKGNKNKSEIREPKK